MNVTGFTMVHNALEGGYPIVEAIDSITHCVDEIIVVDMESTDGTRDLLETLQVEIWDGAWIPGGGDHACLDLNWRRFAQCPGDIIWHFEADEIFDEVLCSAVTEGLHQGYESFSMLRVQIEQNFQRIRWYPHYVHRVFPKRYAIESAFQRRGHTTTFEEVSQHIGPQFGFVWDVTNCFRDNWEGRRKNNAELHGTGLNSLAVPEHAIFPHEMSEELFDAEHWFWYYTPLDIPDILKPLVGITNYKDAI